jgi:hypothetical protein
MTGGLSRFIEAVESTIENLGEEAVDELKKQTERAYADRNLLAVAYAVEIGRGGNWGSAGYYYPDDERDPWPVVWAETVHEQQSWHVKPEFKDLLAESPLDECEPTNGFDGHTRADKNNRLTRQIAAGGANRL